jgi:hypothetical protein
MLPLLRGASAGPNVSQLFAATTYSGNDGSRSGATGVNLSSGGLVWFKSRVSTELHSLHDSQRGLTQVLYSSSTNGDSTNNVSLAFGSSGWSVNTNQFGYNNSSGSYSPYVAWSFARAARFFDVVTYTGTGSARTVAHSLGATPGMIIVKRRDTSSTIGWITYHRSQSGTPQNDYLRLNTTAAVSTGSSIWNNTAPTASEFTVGTNDDVNASGGTYVAYLFAHDTASDGIVQCGSYTGTGTSGNTVTLGWQPQWVLFKRAVQPSGADPWIILDATRGVNNSLCPNTSSAENGDVGVTGSVTFTSTGFTLNDSTRALNNNTNTYVYSAIRSA